MKKGSTAQRLKQIMEARNIRQVDILEAAKPFCARYAIRLNKNDLSQYVTGKVEPGQEKLSILGMALGVSEAWLMGYDVQMERIEAPISEAHDGRAVEFVQLFSQLTAEQQNLVISQIKGILQNQ